MMDTLYTIKQVSERTGLSIHTLRYYERIGVLYPVDRLDNGHRRYDETDLSRKKFPGLTDELVENTLAIFDAAERVTLPDPVPQVSRDPKDDIFLACAAIGKADYLLSEDNDLLVLETHRETKVVNVPTFFEIIRPSESSEN